MRNIHDVDADYIFRETGTEDIDVILGGPPCQAFSSIAIAGRFWFNTNGKTNNMLVVIIMPIKRNVIAVT